MNRKPPPSATRWQLVEVEPGARQAFEPLMRLADDSATEIERYRDLGTLFGLYDLGRPEPCGLVLAAAAAEPGAVQLLSVAIDEPLQGRGLGRRLLGEVLDRLTARGWTRAMVSTASSSVSVLAFYQRLGFRMLRIERDHFGPERGYPPGLEENGIPVRDLVWLDRPL